MTVKEARLQLEKIKPIRYTNEEPIVIKASPTMKQLRKILKERIKATQNDK